MFEEEFARLSVEPPRGVESLPGLRLRGAIPTSAIILPLIFVSFFLTIPLSIMNADPAMRLAMGTTESTQGHVISITSGSACRAAASHHVTYSFSSESDHEYRGGANLCEESPYYSVNPGDEIPVRFLKSDPAVNALPDDGRNQSPPIALFFFMPFFFLAIFAPLFWPTIREVLRARRLFKNGRLATGKVIFIKKRTTSLWPGMPGNSACDVYIEFLTPTGKHEAVAWCQNDWLINQLVPGASVHVAYLDKSDKVALLEGFLR